MSTLNVPALIRRAHQKKKKLGLFLKRLKKKNPKNILSLQKKASAEAWAITDCLECANCCKTMTPTFTKGEIKRISERVGMTYDKYFEKYLKVDEDNGDIVNKTTPCQHLGKDNKCKVYDIRPGDCSGFPHFLRRDFWHQVDEKTYISNVPRCPVTLRFVENLERLVEEGK
jgi:Fe-S-cluster containining protein